MIFVPEIFGLFIEGPERQIDWHMVDDELHQMHPKKLKLAMALRGTHKHYRIAEIERRHFNATAHQCGLGTDIEPIIADVVSKTPAVIERVAGRLPKGFPAELFDSVTTGLQKAATRLERMAP